MRSRQIAERLGVEEAHMLEFQQFNMAWDKKMADYERHAEELVLSMRVRSVSPKIGTVMPTANLHPFNVHLASAHYRTLLSGAVHGEGCVNGCVACSSYQWCG